MKLKTEITVQSITNLVLLEIQKFDNIAILHHKSPDHDAYGSQHALRAWIELNYPTKVVVTPCNETNIIQPLFSTLTEQFIPPTWDNYLVIVVDCANEARVCGSLTDATSIVVIDHHPQQLTYGTINLINDQIGSCAQIVAQLLLDAQQLINESIVKWLISGMISDTQRFLFRTDHQSFHILKQLTEQHNIPLENLYDNMYQHLLDPMFWKLKRYLMNMIAGQTAFAYVRITERTKIKYQIKEGYVTSIMEELAQAKSYKLVAWFTESSTSVKERKSFVIKVSLRSNHLNVNELAQKYQGGGHDKAAGFIVASWKNINEFITLVTKHYLDAPFLTKWWWFIKLKIREFKYPEENLTIDPYLHQIIGDFNERLINKITHLETMFAEYFLNLKEKIEFLYINELQKSLGIFNFEKKDNDKTWTLLYIQFEKYLIDKKIIFYQMLLDEMADVVAALPEKSIFYLHPLQVNLQNQYAQFLLTAKSSLQTKINKLKLAHVNFNLQYLYFQQKINHKKYPFFQVVNLVFIKRIDEFDRQYYNFLFNHVRFMFQTSINMNLFD